MEPVLAIFHYLMIFTALALLVGEFLLLRLDATGPTLKMLGRVNLAFGVFALLVVVSGLLRVFLGTVPPTFWASSHAFWGKMTIVAVIGLLSVGPSRSFREWRKVFEANGALPDAAARKKVGRTLHIELALFVFLPIFAVLMAEAADKAVH